MRNELTSIDNAREGKGNGGSAENRTIEPLFYDAFIRIFGQEESVGITRSLINSVLEHAEIELIDEILSIEAEHTVAAGSVECRSGRMDVRVVAAGKRIIDLEAQRYPEDIDSRSVFYASQLIVANTPKGVSYKDIPQAVIITLLDDAPLFPDKKGFVSVSRMAWRTKGAEDIAGEPMDGSDRILFVLVELEKVRERYNELDEEVLADPLLSWLYLLTTGFEDAKEADEIMCMYPDLREFAEMYGRAIDDPEVIRAYENEAAAYREYQSRKDYFERVEREATERGEAKGFAAGEAKGFAAGEAKGIEIGIDKGIEKGIEQGKIALLVELVHDGVLSQDDAAKRIGVDIGEFSLLVDAGTQA